MDGHGAHPAEGEIPAAWGVEGNDSASPIHAFDHEVLNLARPDFDAIARSHP